jgi:hypothetical protein
MQTLKSFVEWYLGNPPSEPGEGTAWRFEYRAPWPDWLPDWCVLLLVLGVVAYVILIYRRDAQRASLPTRLTLIALRLVAVAAVLLFLSRWVLSVDRIGLPVVVIMVDVSASFGLEDHFSDRRNRAAVKELFPGGDETAATRLELAKRLLTRDKAEFLRRLQQRHKLRVYQFAAAAAPLGNSEYRKPDEIDDLVAHVNALAAEGEQTRPGPSVREVLDELRGTPPSAIVVFTDGIASITADDRLSTVADLAATKLVPIFTVGIGSEEPTRDVELYDLLVDDVAFVDDPILFSARLKGYGFEGRAVVVSLTESGSAGVLAHKNVTLPPDGKPLNVELSYVPASEGEYDFTLTASGLPQESNDDNNDETRHVSVREERIRVLLADWQPRYEFRYLKHLLERDRSIELRTVLQEADVEYAAEDKTALEHFPVRRDELLQYDVIIFGDMHPAYLSSSVYEMLRDFVRDVGGGVIFIAGTHHNPLAYRETPLDVLFPIELSSVTPRAEETLWSDGFRPDLTLAGRRGTALFRFGESDEQSKRIWKNLPTLQWLLPATKLKSGAVVFAQHPLQDETAGKAPVICLQRYGAGRVLYHATDELYRWRGRNGDLYYGKYWIQAIRLLSRSRLVGRDRAAELTTDRLVYKRGESVELRLRFLDQPAAPLENDGVTVMVEQRGSVQLPVKLSRLPRATTVFQGRFTPTSAGSFHAWVVAPSFQEHPPSADFRVEAPQLELSRRGLDRADLMQAAKSTRGKYYAFADARQLPNDIPAGHPIPLETKDPIPLWNRWEFLLLFALVLTAEWLLRKRCRLI